MNTEQETKSIAYSQGALARKEGIPLEDSALRALRPGSSRYDDFIAGYDSVEVAATRPATNLDAAQTLDARLSAANSAFEHYDFADGVYQADGWDTSDCADLSRIVHGEEGRYCLHVRFDAGQVEPCEVYALDMATGNNIGHAPA